MEINYEPFSEAARVNPYPYYRALREHQDEAALAGLRRAVQADPSRLDAQAKLGARLLAESEQEFKTWLEALPPRSEEWPEIWFLRSKWAARRNETSIAARCCYETLRRAPTHQRACYAVAGILSQLGDETRAIPYRRQAAALQEVVLATKQYHSQPSPEKAWRAATACADAGLTWEAWAWRAIARPSESPPDRPEDGLPRCDPQSDPSAAVGLTDLPLPQTLVHEIAVRSPKEPNPPRSAAPRQPVETRPSSIRFVEESQDVGVRFRYVNGDDSRKPGIRFFQFTGGGVAVLDYDFDHRPELFFTQGSAFPELDTDSQLTCLLYTSDAADEL